MQGGPFMAVDHLSGYMALLKRQQVHDSACWDLTYMYFAVLCCFAFLLSCCCLAFLSSDCLCYILCVGGHMSLGPWNSQITEVIPFGKFKSIWDSRSTSWVHLWVPDYITTVHVTYCCSSGDHGGSWLRGVASDSCNGTAPEGCAQSSGHTAVDENTDSNGDDHTEQDEEEDGETNS